MSIPSELNQITQALPEHSRYGASSSHRWLVCPASIPMSEGEPDEPDEFSEIGEAGHRLGEFCLKTGVNTYDCLGLTFNSVEVDHQMADAVQLYVSYVRDLCFKYNVNPMLEKRVVMTSVRNDVYGTADCVIIVGEWLFIIDYKHGYDVVSEVNNSQTIHYAISTLDTLMLWEQIKYVRTVIVQPHGFHTSGSIREYDYSTHELIQWRERFRNAIAVSEAGSEPVAGSHCKRCPARATCLARFMMTVNLVFNNGKVSIESLIPLFIALPEINAHLDAVKAKMLEHAREGGNIEGYKLVKSAPNKKCIDEEGFVKSAMFLTDRDKSEFYNQKLKARSELEKLVNGDEVIINDYFKSIGKPTTKLVTLDDSRPAVSKGKAKGVFAPVEAKPNSAVGVFGKVN